MKFNASWNRALAMAWHQAFLAERRANDQLLAENARLRADVACLSAKRKPVEVHFNASSLDGEKITQYTHATHNID